MNFYAFNIGDYAGATRHLSWDEDMAYRRMLDAYYSREAPLPLDPRQIYRLVGASDERQREAVNVVLAEFFEQAADGWHNNRADEEIAKATEKASHRNEKRENEKERQRRHRMRRKELFDLLRERGIVPPFDASTKDLEDLAAKPQPVTRDRALRVSGENVTSTATGDVQRDSRQVTRDNRPVTHNVTRDIGDVTQDATAINPNPNPNKDSYPLVSRAPESDPDANLEHTLRKAAGWENHPNPKLAITGPIQALLDNGADLELDVLPTIKAIATQCTTPSWNFFVKAIARSRDRRIEAATVITMPSPSERKPAHGTPRLKPSRAETFDRIYAALGAAEAVEGEVYRSDESARDPDEG